MTNCAFSIRENETVFQFPFSQGDCKEDVSIDNSKVAKGGNDPSTCSFAQQDQGCSKDGSLSRTISRNEGGTSKSRRPKKRKRYVVDPAEVIDRLLMEFDDFHIASEPPPLQVVVREIIQPRRSTSKIFPKC